MDPHSQFIKHPSGEITHYIADSFADPWKARETILIQGGFARHAAFFYQLVPALSRHYNVIRRDLRGHGYSSSPAIGEKPNAYSLDTILEEIVDTLDQLNIQKVHFFGESTSGMLGEIFAARHPERLLSLTICSSPTHLPPPTQTFLAFGEDNWPDACRKLGSRGWGEALSSRPGTMASSDPEYRKWWLEQISISSGEGLGSYAEFLCTLDSRPYLSSIKVPTLILAPTRSAATTVQAQKEIQMQIAGAKLAEIDGPGHEIYSEATEKCLQAYLAFLDELRT